MATQSLTSITLDNGLKVFLLNDPLAALASVRTYVRAGSVTEGPYLGSGASHYLEHMVAGGATTKRSERDYKEQISRLGGAFNAYTTTDHTSYYINTVTKDIKTAIDVLYEWMFFCKFESKAFDRERDVIIKEIEKNNASVPRMFYDLSMQNFYKYHPIRLPIIGYLKNFKQLKKQDLITYYHNFYVPANMVLVVGGNFDEKELLDHIKKTFGSIPDTAPPIVYRFNEPVPFTERTAEKTGDTHTTHFSIRFSTIDLFSKELYALDLLEFILGNGEDSILYKRMVDEKKLAYTVNCTSYTPSVTTGYFEVSFEVDYNKIDAVKQEFYSILSEIKAKNLDAKRIERARKQKLAEDIFSVADMEDRVARIGQAYVFSNSEYFFDEYVKNFRHVSAEDVVHVAREYLKKDKAVYAVLKPQEKKIKPAAVSKNKKTAAQIQPIPKKTTLPNGIRVLLYPEKSMPRVFVKIFVMGGLRAETKKNNGIGNLTADLLGTGALHYTKDQINQIIEDNGATLYGALGNNTLYYNLACLSEDLNQLLPLMAQTFLHPVFTDKALSESKRIIKQGIVQRQDDWYNYGCYLLKKEFYKTHPYGLPTNGELDTIERCTTQDIAMYFETMLNPKEMVITVFGDFNEEAVRAQIETGFGALKPAKSVYNPKRTLACPPHKKAVEWTQDIPQEISAVFLGFDGATYQQNEEIVKLNLVDAVLSGMNYPGGRLHDILREKGYVYVVHGIHRPGIEPGMFMIYALTSPEKAQEVKKIILAQIEDIKKNKISQKEFENALAQLKFFYKDRIASTDAMSIITATDELYGRGFDFYIKADAIIQRLTLEDVTKTAKKYLNNPQVLLLK